MNHLVVQLVFLNRKNPTDHIDFPVFPHKPMTAERIAVWEGKVQGMSKIAVAGIERLQPYNWRKDFPVGYHPLEILVGLNDWDKHKTLTFVGPKPVQRSAVITYPSGVQVTMKAFKNVPFKSHAELMRIPWPST